MKHTDINRRQFLKSGALAASGAALPLKAFSQEKMQERLIPGTTESLPVIGLGAPSIFINLPEEGRELPKSVIQTMVDMGGRLIDTPAFFRPNPPVIGELLGEMGLTDELFLAGKITVNGREAAINHFEKTVANLNKRPIDLLLIHNMRELEQNWPMLKEWKEQGRVRYIGVSLTRRTDYSPLEDFMKAEQPDFIMNGYSITQQGAAERVLPLARDLGIGVIGAEPFKAVNDGAFFSMVADAELPEWVAEFGCDTWAKYALKWILADPAMTSVVTETSKVKHVIDNMGAGFGSLPDEATRKRMSDHLLALA